MFRNLKYYSIIVFNIVNSTFSLPPCLREGYLLSQFQLLKHKASTLIFLVEDEKIKASSKVLDVSLVNLIRKKLFLEQDADFFVLLGFAEKYNPGIYKSLLGDPDMIEEKFIDLFQGW